MSEELLIRHCSPTLAGLKTANLFNCEYETEEELKTYLREINAKLSGKGVRVMPLRYGANRALIYLFRPDDLEKDLRCEEARKILKKTGYDSPSECKCFGCAGVGPSRNDVSSNHSSRNDVPTNHSSSNDISKNHNKCFGKCLATLQAKLKNESIFPHEIGLFLGYPPEDVKGFIEEGSRKCKCVGTWRVYGDERKARKTFAQYKKCNDIYGRLYAEGRPMEKLTVGK